MKRLPVYELVVARKGPKLTLSKRSLPPGSRPMPITEGGRGVLKARSVPMSFFTQWLSGFVSGRADLGNRIVLNRTGLSGTYDFTLKWSPVETDTGVSSAADAGQMKAGPLRPDSGPSLFTALQEQLGLKLVPRKGPVQVLVIDHIERPSPN